MIIYHNETTAFVKNAEEEHDGEPEVFIYVSLIAITKGPLEPGV
jgi:hypothetical protein